MSSFNVKTHHCLEPPGSANSTANMVLFENRNDRASGTLTAEDVCCSTQGEPDVVQDASSAMCGGW